MLAFLIVIVPLSLGIGFAAARPWDRSFVLIAIAGAWLILAPVTALLNIWMPFAGGGDDETYFRLAAEPAASLWHALNPNRFVDVMGQPGYPWMLSILNAVAGHELLVFKWLNLFFLILTALTWYRIALLIAGGGFARRVMLAVLLLTPLWFYVFFLLKDLTITLLQSLFLLAAIQIWNGGKVRPVIGFGASTLPLILFRVPLVVQNAGVLTGSLLLKAIARGTHGRRLLPLVLGTTLVYGILSISANPSILNQLGVIDDARVLGTAAMFDLGKEFHERSEMNRALFPVLYLIGETTALNPTAWEQRDSRWLRGLLALPWILWFAPFFLLGLRWLLRAPAGQRRAPARLGRLLQARIIATPWSAIFLFVASSALISWVAGDSTRWRIPDMPMFAAIAVAGWSSIHPAHRQLLLVGWIGSVMALASLYHLLKG